jgi:hypothetical protein
VQFKDGGSSLGSPVTLSNGTATFTTSALSVSAHTITAVYGGDTSFTESTGSLPTQTVNKDDTGTGLSSSLNPSNIGQPISFTASVTATGPGSGIPTGTVTFFDGTGNLGVGTLDMNGHTTFTTASLSAGIHNITAQYGGDSNFSTSTSPALAQVVGVADVAVTLTHHPVISAIGGTLVFAATVANHGPSSANVSFTEQFTGKFVVADATDTAGPCTINNGQVSCPLGTINNGDNVAVTVRLIPLPLTRTIEATATATPDVVDNIPGNNTATDAAVIRFKPFVR